MILPGNDRKMIDPSEASEALASTPSGQPFIASGSSNTTVKSSLPPVNDTSLNNGHLLIDTSLGPPPEFTRYEAEHFEVGYSDVVSHDPHLNSDGEALYRFLLDQATSSPSHRISCRGTHTEVRYRMVTEVIDGRTQSRQESYAETVTDFYFCIDIVPNGSVTPIQWSVADDQPAYRGLMVREFEGSTGSEKQVATSEEIERYKEWERRRKGLGLPPWVSTVDNNITDGSMCGHLDTLRSSKTLRQWADEYCASPKYLKEFVYKKDLYGWNMQQIESAIRTTIKSSPYHGDLHIGFTPYGSKVYIRPDNAVSRMLSNKWLKFLSIILLIFPFIWLFKRFHSRGGGRWEVCGGAYPLKQWVPVDPGEETSSDPLPPYNPSSTALILTAGQRAQGSTRHMQTLTGPKKLLGVKEGEWFRNWEGVIIRAVIGRYQSSIPLNNNDRGVSGLPVRSFDLDGYNEY